MAYDDESCLELLMHADEDGVSINWITASASRVSSFYEFVDETEKRGRQARDRRWQRDQEDLAYG